MHGGQASLYMQNHSLTTDVAMVPIVEKLVPEWLTPVPPGTSTPTTLDPPPAGQFPSDDPLLTAAATRRCNGAVVDQIAWDKWITSMSNAVGGTIGAV